MRMQPWSSLCQLHDGPAQSSPEAGVDLRARLVYHAGVPETWLIVRCQPLLLQCCRQILLPVLRGCIFDGVEETQFDVKKL